MLTRWAIWSRTGFAGADPDYHRPPVVAYPLRAFARRREQSHRHGKIGPRRGLGDQEFGCTTHDGGIECLVGR